MGTVSKALKKSGQPAGIHHPNSTGIDAKAVINFHGNETLENLIEKQNKESGFNQFHTLELFSERLNRLNTFSRSTDYPEEYYRTKSKS